MEIDQKMTQAKPSIEAFGADVPTGPLLYPNEPSRFTGRDVEPFFIWATQQGASDISIQTDKRIFLEIHGKFYQVTKRLITQSEILEIATRLYENEAAKGRLAGDTPMDFAYTARPDRKTRLRFRLNATAAASDGQRGAQITARTIPSIPPTLAELGIEDEIVNAFAPPQGLVLVTGATGSGKSTLLAANIRTLAEQPNGHRKIITYEAPVEYVYDEVDAPTTLISQHEVYTHIPNFAESIRNALRRKPSIILVGEARDAETIGEAITASMTGHLVYTTVHSNGFADTIRRMVNSFPEGERNARAFDIVSSLRMVVSQTLVPSVDGRRVALREYVIFNDEIVDEILSAGIDNLTQACRRVLKERGRSFLQDASDKFARNLITKEVYDRIARGARSEELDALAHARKMFQRAAAARVDGATLADEWAANNSLPGGEPRLDDGFGSIEDSP